MTGEADRKSGERPDHSKWVCVGVIAGPRGVQGEVRIKSYTAEPKGIASFPRLYCGPGGEEIKLSSFGTAKGMLTARVGGTADRDAAEALKGTELFVPRADLPEPADDEFYIEDLAGLIALDSVGQRVGLVQGIEDFGAGPLLELTLDEPRKNVGRSPMLPFTLALVPAVDIAGGTVTVLLDDWLQEDDDEQDELD